MFYITFILRQGVAYTSKNIIKMKNNILPWFKDNRKFKQF